MGTLTTSPTTASTSTTTQESSNMFLDDIDSGCSTPYVSAPSSPGRTNNPPPPPCSGYYYSAPSSPMHFILSKTSLLSPKSPKKQHTSSSSSFEFDFSSNLKPHGGSNSPGKSMSSADELFLNGQIRPMKLSTHLKRPQILSPLLDCDENEEEQDIDACSTISRGRLDNPKQIRDKSLRRRARSLSPLRSSSRDEEEGHEETIEEIVVQNETKDIKEEDNQDQEEEVPRSSSAGRSSKRWVFLKEFLYRSKSEGSRTKKMDKLVKMEIPRMKLFNGGGKEEKRSGKTVINGNGGLLMGKRRVPPSAHELHYTANRAQSEEMRKKTFLPYRQGLLAGCLGFSSKSYGAWNGFTRTLNPVSSTG